MHRFNLMNLYCTRCKKCIGFYTTVETPVGIYCLECEGAYVAEWERRNEIKQQFEAALKE